MSGREGCTVRSNAPWVTWDPLSPMYRQTRKKTLPSCNFVGGWLISHNPKARKHSSRMRTDRAVTRISSDRVAIRSIVDRMIHVYENITFPCCQEIWLTRLHSSRMRTARSLTVFPSIFCSGGGVWSQGGCLVPGGYPSMHWGRPPPPWTEWQTGVKILPCPKLRLRAVISHTSPSSLSIP